MNLWDDHNGLVAQGCAWMVRSHSYLARSCWSYEVWVCSFMLVHGCLCGALQWDGASRLVSISTQVTQYCNCVITCNCNIGNLRRNQTFLRVDSSRPQPCPPNNNDAITAAPTTTSNLTSTSRFAAKDRPLAMDPIAAAAAAITTNMSSIIPLPWINLLGLCWSWYVMSQRDALD